MQDQTEPRSRIGGCLCGAIRFIATGTPTDPHTCSCEFCRRHSGALTLAWVEFDRDDVRWVGPGGAVAVPLIGLFKPGVLPGLRQLAWCYRR